MNSIIIKKNREKLLDYFSEITYHQVLEHFNTDIEDLGKVLIKRRKLAILKSIFETNRTSTSPDSICWYCKHCTNLYGECSWSADLKPRSDWTKDSYEENCNGLRVKNCNGFDIGVERPLDRKTVEIILTDAFADKDGFISRKYFSRMDEDTLDQWIDIYNDFLYMAELPLISVRRSHVDNCDE